MRTERHSYKSIRSHNLQYYKSANTLRKIKLIKNASSKLINWDASNFTNQDKSPSQYSVFKLNPLSSSPFSCISLVNKPEKQGFKKIFSHEENNKSQLKNKTTYKIRLNQLQSTPKRRENIYKDESFTMMLSNKTCDKSNKVMIINNLEFEKADFLYKDLNIKEILKIPQDILEILNTTQAFVQIRSSSKKYKAFTQYSFNTSDYFFWQSSRYIDDKKYRLSLFECQEGLKKENSYANLLFNLPILLFLNKKFEAFFKESSSELNQKPRHPIYIYNRILCLFVLCNFEELIKDSLDIENISEAYKEKIRIIVNYSKIKVKYESELVGKNKSSFGVQSYRSSQFFPSSMLSPKNIFRRKLKKNNITKPSPHLKTKSFEFDQFLEDDNISNVSNAETNTAIENYEVKSIISNLFLLQEKSKFNCKKDNFSTNFDFKQINLFNIKVTLNYKLYQKIFQMLNQFSEKDKSDSSSNFSKSPSIVYKNFTPQYFNKDFSLMFSTSLLKFESNLSLQKNPFSLNIDCKSLQQVYILKEREILKKGEAFEFICRHQLPSFIIKNNFKNFTIFEGIAKISTINRFLEQVSNVVNSNWKSEEILKSEGCQKFIEIINNNQEINLEIYNIYRNEISKFHINNLIMKIIYNNLQNNPKNNLHYKGKRLSKNVLRVIRNELAKKEMKLPINSEIITKLVSNFKFFSLFKPNVIENLIRSSKYFICNNNTLIYEKNQKANSFYILLDGYIILTGLDNFSAEKIVKPGETFGDYIIQEKEEGIIEKFYDSTAKCKCSIELLVIEHEEFFKYFGSNIFEELQNLVKILLLNKYLFNINPYVLLLLISNANRKEYKLGMIIQKQDTFPERFILIENGNCIAVHESIIFSEYNSNLEDKEIKEESKSPDFLNDDHDNKQNDIKQKLNEIKNSFSFQNKKLFIISSKKEKKIAFRHHNLFSKLVEGDSVGFRTFAEDNSIKEYIEKVSKNIMKQTQKNIPHFHEKDSENEIKSIMRSQLSIISNSCNLITYEIPKFAKYLINQRWNNIIEEEVVATKFIDFDRPFSQEEELNQILGKSNKIMKTWSNKVNNL